MSKLLSKLSHIHMIRILFKPISQHSGLSNKKYTMSPGDANKNLPRPSFVSRNLVAIVMIPAIIGMHYGWVLLQDNKSLVSEKEKIDLPVITAAKYLWRKISPVENDTTTK